MSAPIAVFVRQFYLANSSFFLFIIVLAGGFMRSVDHIILAEFFISTPVVTTLPVSLWVCYIIKVINFNLQAQKENENQFLFCIPFLSTSTQWSIACSVASLQLIPVFLYALFLFVVAWKHAMTMSLAIVLLSSVLLLIVVAFSILRSLQSPHHEKRLSWLSQMVNTRFTKPYILFYIEWMARQQFVMMISSKILSLLILFGITALYKTDIYDSRLLMIGALLASYANITIIQGQHHFENFQLAWTRGLPISLFKRILLTTIVILLVILPEAAVLMKTFPSTALPWTNYLYSMGFMASILLLFYSLLFRKHRNQKEAMPTIFTFAIVCFLLVLFKIPVLSLMALNVSLALFLWMKNYYSFEYLLEE
jgi:hypothetical protein